MTHIRLTFIFILFTMGASAQWFQPVQRQGDVFIGWGWNRATYTKSDISFKGDTYNFTLYDVIAKDRQTAFQWDIYFKPSTITIPQTNLRMGYFFKDHWAITVGVDHMKYVMQQNNTVNITGNIDDPNYSSMIHNGTILLAPEFLKFEHTDGLNYINSEIEYHQGIFKKGIFQLNGFAGAGAGALMPKTNVTLMSYPRNDHFHLAGFGVDAKLGLEIILWKYIFIRFEGKEGFIDMPNIVTRQASIADRAKQHFFFTERDAMFGVTYPLVKKKATEPKTN